MDIRYIGSGEPGENEVCEVFGLSFALNEWVTVPDNADPAHVAKLSANPTFETRGAVAPPSAVDASEAPAKPKRGRPPKVSPTS